MYLKTPMMFGRKMKKLKEYKRFVLFVDEKTGIRECFSYFDLSHEEIDKQIYKYNENGMLELVDPIKKITTNKVKVKNDTRLYDLLNLM